jgi:hypothetical protein
MTDHAGGCLCGAIRYRTRDDPLRVTICHCRFCQHVTGSAFLIEPVFKIRDFEITSGVLRVYQHRSVGSGKLIDVNFCPTCGTRIYFGLERVPDIVAVHAGTFDDPEWFEIRPDNSRHVFLESARRGTIIPPGFKAFFQHAMQNDGTPIEPMYFDHPHIIGTDH